MITFRRDHKQESKRGATRTQAPVSRVRRISLKPLLLLMLLAISPLAANRGWLELRDLIDRPVSRVIVEGNFHFVERSRLIDLVSEGIERQDSRANFFALDLSLLQSLLQSESWVDEVSVERRWPDVLIIKVVEQKPIARWSNQGFLNQRGALIVAGERAELSDLPLLSGLPSNEEAVMNQYLGLQQLLRTRNLTIKQLEQTATGAWNMRLNNGVEIAMGRTQLTEKVQRLLLVYDRRLRNEIARVSSIDLRYNNGVAVAWQRAELNDENNAGAGGQGLNG